jgi:hypothetical protein
MRITEHKSGFTKVWNVILFFYRHNIYLVLAITYLIIFPNKKEETMEPTKTSITPTKYWTLLQSFYYVLPKVTSKVWNVILMSADMVSI